MWSCMKKKKKRAGLPGWVRKEQRRRGRARVAEGNDIAEPQSMGRPGGDVRFGKRARGMWAAARGNSKKIRPAV